MSLAYIRNYAAIALLLAAASAAIAAPDCGPEWVNEQYVIPQVPKHPARVPAISKRRIADPAATVRPMGERWVLVDVDCDEESDGLPDGYTEIKPEAPPVYAHVPPELVVPYIITPKPKPGSRVPIPGTLALLGLGALLLFRRK